VIDLNALVRAASHRRATLAFAFATLGAGLGALLLGPFTREDVLRHFHADVAQQVLSLIEQGREAEALDALESASLIDADRLEMLNRMERLNRAAGLSSGTRGGSPFQSRSAEAELRFRIGRALYLKLTGLDDPGSEQPVLLERAMENARLLVEFEPDSARSHFLLGIMHLLRWNKGGDAGERVQATVQLQKVLMIKPTHAGAERALQVARLPRS
jgi:hypothetical protein